MKNAVSFCAFSGCAIDFDLTAMEIEFFISKNEDFPKKILVFGTADKIRTCDLQSRSLTLYPAELQPRMWNDRLAAVIRFFNNSGQTVVKNPRLLSPETRNRCVAKALRLISTECA